MALWEAFFLISAEVQGLYCLQRWKESMHRKCAKNINLFFNIQKLFSFENEVLQSRKLCMQNLRYLHGYFLHAEQFMAVCGINQKRMITAE